MITQTFPEYLSASFSSQNSRAYPSYIQAIKIMDQIFSENDKFNLRNKSLSEIKDPHLIDLIIFRKYLIHNFYGLNIRRICSAVLG